MCAPQIYYDISISIPPPVSRGISKAVDMAAASIELRDEINVCREAFLISAKGT